MGWDLGDLRTPDGVRLRVGTMRIAGPVATCLLLQGRGDFLEKHASAGRQLAALGMDVLSFDWRGQGGSERTAGPGVSDVSSFDRYLDDVEAVVGSYHDPQRPLVIVAHSMGGLVATTYLLRWPTAVTSAVLLSPMLAFRGAPPALLIRGIAAIARMLGLGRQLASGERAADPRTCTIEDNMATSDPDAFATLRNLQLEHPDLVVAGSSWRWAAAASVAMQRVARADLGVILTDVLLASAPDDPTVDPGAHADLVARLPAATLRRYEARHDLLYASSPTVQTLWADVADHLARTVPVRT